MLVIVILTTLLMYWGLFANLTVVLTFAIPTILFELIANYFIEKEEKHV